MNNPVAVVMSNPTLDRTRLIELQGRTFAPAEGVVQPEWPCTTLHQQLETLTLKDNDLFLITDTLANIPGCLGEGTNRRVGFFCQDTRFLTRMEVQINGEPLVLFNSSAQQGYALTARCANPEIQDAAGMIPARTIAIQREMVLQGGLFEELTLTNFGNRPVTFEVSLSFSADFADLFEIRGYFMRSQNGRLLQHVRSQSSPPSSATPEAPLPPTTQELILAYQGLDQVLMETRIQFCRRQPDRFDGYTALWQLELQPQQREVLGYQVRPFINNQPASLVTPPATLHQALAVEKQAQAEWQARMSCIRTDNSSLNQTIAQAEKDIFLLEQTFDDGKALSAGVPWFSTLFGRDSIIAAMQTLMLEPDIARQTLRVLAQHQGQTTDKWRDEEPGKILHELRLGELARCAEVPHTPYFGTVDATPLWLMLLAEYYTWTGDQQLIDDLWDNALAAMAWIDQSCAQTDGYLRYQRHGDGGLLNQGWKDSLSCIVDSQGEFAKGSIALVEVQGYVYAAKVRLSRIARSRGQLALADRWEQEAAVLKAQFSQDFWLPEQNFVALALDGDGQPMDSITSNPGHCLSSGILTPEQSHGVAKRLMAPDMFSGWGVRTLSSDSPAYNPMGYHVGSIWPHDNGMIAAGLRSQGYIAQALAIATGILDMTAQQTYHRPPELICGFERTDSGSLPVPYPVACSPQAWATGTIFQLLQTMVNVIPDAPNNQLRIVHPTLPESINHLHLRHLKVGDSSFDLELAKENGVTICRVLNKKGNVTVLIED